MLSNYFIKIKKSPNASCCSSKPQPVPQRCSGLPRELCRAQLREARWTVRKSGTGISSSGSCRTCCVWKKWGFPLSASNPVRGHFSEMPMHNSMGGEPKTLIETIFAPSTFGCVTVKTRCVSDGGRRLHWGGEIFSVASNLSMQCPHAQKARKEGFCLHSRAGQTDFFLLST